MTKERLQELIEQGASVWCVNNRHVSKKVLKWFENECASKRIYITQYGLEIEITGEDGYISMYKFDQIFETEEQATHHAKYGNITRTEKMPVPPTWEEFCKKHIMIDTFGNAYFDTNKKFAIITKKNKQELTLWVLGKEKECLNLPNTQQNYELALDKMVQLFKGE